MTRTSAGTHEDGTAFKDVTRGKRTAGNKRIDYKGKFQLGDKRYCYPVTVTDHASRFLLLCEATESNRSLSGHLKSGQRRSPENRPMRT